MKIYVFYFVEFLRSQRSIYIPTIISYGVYLYLSFAEYEEYSSDLLEKSHSKYDQPGVLFTNVRNIKELALNEPPRNSKGDKENASSGKER